LRLNLRASPVLTLLTAAMHCAAAAILLAVLPSPAGVIAAILLVVLGVLAVRERTLLMAARSPSGLVLNRDGGVSLGLRNGDELSGQVAARRYVSRWLVVFCIEAPPRGRRTILIVRDMLPAGEFRHLRLWALWNALPAPRPACAARDA
jgi:hypothetical protein